MSKHTRRTNALARRARTIETNAAAFLKAYRGRRKPEDYWRVPDLQAWLNWRNEWMIECLRQLPSWRSDPEQYPYLTVKLRGSPRYPYDT